MPGFCPDMAEICPDMAEIDKIDAKPSLESGFQQL
jgi:hypothetical protein